jgi:hypothetical protein
VLKGQPQSAAPAAAAAGGSAKQPQQGCNSWELSELPSLSAAVEQHQKKRQLETGKHKTTVEEGLELRDRIQGLSKQYDWGGAFFKDVAKQVEPKDMVSLA